jgi:hypothetical protein
MPASTAVEARNKPLAVSAHVGRSFGNERALILFATELRIARSKK